MVTFKNYTEKSKSNFKLPDFLYSTPGAPSSTEWWNTTDCEDTLKSNLKSRDSKLVLEKYGYLDNPISYEYNSTGFRSNEFDKGKGLVTLGCSFTFGTGLHLEEVWGSKLAEKLKLPLYNLGSAGTSINTSYRLLLTYLDKIDIHTVALLGPNNLRTEQIGKIYKSPTAVEERDHIFNLGPWDQVHLEDPKHDKEYNFVEKYKKSFFLNEPNYLLNYSSNLNAIRYLCLKNHIRFVYIYIEDVRDYLNYVLYNNQDIHLTGLCKARDLSHWSRETHSFIADLFFNSIHMKDTSYNLSDYGITSIY
jgi:hypothetical protein